FTRSVIDYARTHPEIHVVILSSSLFQYVDPGAGQLMIEGEASPVATSTPTAVSALGRTVDTLRALGKRVVLVAPPPSSGENIGLCLERRSQGKLRFGGTADCSIGVRDYLTARASVLELVDSVSRRFDLPVFRFDRFLCDSERCVTQIGSTFLYRGQMPFTRQGSRLIGQRLSLTDSLLAAAR